MKICSKCKQKRRVSQFGKWTKSTDGRQCWCRDCTRDYRSENHINISAAKKKYYLENKDDIRAAVKRHYAKNRGAICAYNRRHRAENKDMYRAHRRNKTYGLTPKEFEAMRTGQNNCCACCKIEFFKEPHVDHNHKTGAVRGLLCHQCNTGLGLFKDAPANLRQAAAYLENFGD